MLCVNLSFRVGEVISNTNTKVCQSLLEVPPPASDLDY